MACAVTALLDNPVSRFHQVVHASDKAMETIREDAEYEWDPGITQRTDCRREGGGGVTAPVPTSEIQVRPRGPL